MSLFAENLFCRSESMSEPFLRFGVVYSSLVVVVVLFRKLQI